MTLLFDNYDGYDFDQFKREYLEWNDTDYVDDYTIWDIIGEQEQDDWDGAVSELVNLFGSMSSWGSQPYSGVIAKGTAGGWRGTREAMQFFDNIGEALEYITKDCDLCKIWQDDRGRVFIRASHHDGTHEFELKRVTKQGWSYYWNWNDGENPRTANKDEWEILSTIWNRYSQLPKKI